MSSVLEWRSSPQVETRVNHGIEVAGEMVKAISSNVRRPDLPWQSYKLRPGVGREGNLVVVEVVTDSGFRTAIEGQDGVERNLFKGDKFVAVLANRHSGTSESGDVPPEGIEISENTRLDLLAAGAIVGVSSGVPGRGQAPLKLKPLGLITDNEKSLDLIELCGGHHESLNPSAPIIMVCGTSAEVGKTTTSRGLIRALRSESKQVAGTKFAGTGRMRDILSLRDAGAQPWLDFPDIGLATTYTSPERFTPGIYTLFNYLNTGKPDIIVAEAGGDPIEANIPTFLQDSALMRNVKAFVLVAGDVMGMMGSIPYIKKFAPDIPMYLANPKGRNTFTTRERIRHELPGYPIFNSLDSNEVHDIAKQILRT